MRPNEAGWGRADPAADLISCAKNWGFCRFPCGGVPRGRTAPAHRLLTVD
jgi:hypothetical protein